jgi:cancer susceptibility candidate protein 1
MLQSRCTDYPYTSWKLRSIDHEKAILNIETKRGLELVFEIGADYVSLIERDEPELKHITGNKYAPGYILYLLSKSGIHLMPVD